MIIFVYLYFNNTKKYLIMKTIFIRMALLMHIFLSLFTMALAILLPFTFGMKDFSYWSLIAYPLTLFFIASQEETFKIANKYFQL